jgi:hypothetical protein
MWIRRSLAVLALFGVVACSIKLLLSSSYGQGDRTLTHEQAVDLSAELLVPPEKQWKTLTISSTRSVKSDLIIPANVCLKFENGGMCEIDNGAILSINGPLEAPLAQIFRGNGKVTFGSGRVGRVYPQWWGAQTDDGMDDTAAIQAAIDSLSSTVPWVKQPLAPNGGIIFFPGGRYDLTSRLKIYDGTTLEGTPNRTELCAARGISAIIQRSDLTPPPAGIHYNIATRINGVRIANLLLRSEAAAALPADLPPDDPEALFRVLRFEDDAPEVGLDLTNVSYSQIDNVTVTHCETGIRMGELSTYNTLTNPAIAYCETGVEVNLGTMDNNIFGGRLSAVGTGIKVNNTGHLNIYGMTFDAFKATGLEVKTGGSVNLHYPWFDSVPPSTPVKIAPQAYSCSIVKPRFAGTTPRIIDNQSDSTLILDATSEGNLVSDLLRTKSLQTSGISQTTVKAQNLRGSVAISGAESSAAIAFAAPEPDENYFVTATSVSATGNPLAGARNVYVTGKSSNGFEVCVQEAPGEGSAVQVDWILVR